jgi:hypothetical protein
MEKKMPRKVVTTSPHREVGIVNPSWLLDHPVEHESHLERRFIMLALSCPVVTDIVHQPFELKLVHGPDDTGTYTPDFKVCFRDGDHTIAEVKAEVFVAENRRKLDAAKLHLAAQDQKFDLFTEKHIDANQLSARAMLLMRYARLSFGDAEMLECKRLLEEECAGSAYVHELMSKGVNEHLIWNMVARHHFKIPVGLNLTPLETVEINNPQGECHVYFQSWFGLTRG